MPAPARRPESSLLRVCPLLSSPAPPCSILCVVHNSPARWRGVASSLFQPITHPVGPQQGCGQDRAASPLSCLPPGPQPPGTGSSGHGWAISVPGAVACPQGSRLKPPGHSVVTQHLQDPRMKRRGQEWAGKAGTMLPDTGRRNSAMLASRQT